MTRIDTVIVGGGYAGLAMSRCLTNAGIAHVVLERGRIAERWRSERWDSLRLLTPNWHTRLPDWCYRGDDPDGFMRVSEFISFLEAYARSFDAPIHTGVTVTSVVRSPTGFRVLAGAQTWDTRTLVIATGHCDVPFVPAFAENLDPSMTQLPCTHYRNPKQLPPGGVLVVGAGASGAQIAEELVNADRPVTLSVGRHRRRPRRYRDRDILWWVERMGLFRARPEPGSERAFPAPQLVGSPENRSLDLGILQARGVRLASRILSIEGGKVRFDANLEQTVEKAEREMRELLARVDKFALAKGLGGHAQVPEPLRPGPGPEHLDLGAEGICSVIWATGYRRAYPWLDLDIVDAEGELRHSEGVTVQPGVYAVGLRRQRRYHSNFIDGVGEDAAWLTDHLKTYLGAS